MEDNFWPKLDDRGYNDLLQEAKAVIAQKCPEWTDHSPGDPGITLVEVFAHLTDIQLYRLNRVPNRVHAVLLDLLGVTRLAPSAATVELTFSRDYPEMTDPIRIPAGTVVTDARGTVAFETLSEVELTETEVSVLASHSTYLRGEILGSGTAEGGQLGQVRVPPIVRNTEIANSLTIGVELTDEEPASTHGVISEFEKSFAVWKEVLTFHNCEKDDLVYHVDRASGRITFGNGESGASPNSGREIRAWYRTGGGRDGNVVGGSLTALTTRIAGVSVINKERAVGGESLESNDDLLARGKDAVRSLRTAVTASDFERVALQAGGVARANANALRELWRYASPGVVDIRIVPKIKPPQDGAITLALVEEHQRGELLDSVRKEVALRQPLGVDSNISFTQCRPVSVSANVVVSRAESVASVESAIKKRLNRLLSPQGTWPHGKMLRASDIYEVLLSEPAVRYAENIGLEIEDAPTDRTNYLLRDPHRDKTVFAGTDSGAFLTEELARGWERLVLDQDRSKIISMAAHPEVAGLIAAVGENETSDVHSILVSRDAGQTWDTAERLQNENVYSLDWMSRTESNATLYIASKKSLRRLEIRDGSGSNNITELERDGGPGGNGFYAVAAARHPMDVPIVAIAARELGGVLISRQGGAANSFEKVQGTDGLDIRNLRFKTEGERMYLWASVAAAAGKDGIGLIRIEARAAGLDPDKPTTFEKGWKGGTCESFDFSGNTLVAGTNRAGVLKLDLSSNTPVWEACQLDCGLPINNERSALLPVTAISISDPVSNRVIAGTEQGLFVSTDDVSYEPHGGRRFLDSVPLPRTWLYCSGLHKIEITQDSDPKS